MGVHLRRMVALGTFCAMCCASVPAGADEIRLKDGKKLNGVIVGYEENMFKVKTDFGYVLVEKDKIASIIPATPASPEKTGKLDENPDPTRNAVNSSHKQDSGPGTKAEAGKTAVNSVAPGSKPSTPAVNGVAKPDASANLAVAQPTAPAPKGSPPKAEPVGPVATPPPAAKEPEIPAIREDVQGNLYTNYTHGFRMYKAPSWQLIDDARNALPNAIVAMGTSNESSLMVIGREKTKEPLDAAAITVEARLHDVYDNYQRVSQRKTSVGNSPAVEFRYRGKADEHDWSGTLVVLSHSGDIFTVLGMTYADSDLIQIQENVIAKAIGSLTFDMPEAKK